MWARRGGFAVALFVVSYDLIKGKDYQPLWDELDQLGGHKALESFYLLNLTTEDPYTLKEHLRAFVDSDDMLMVVKFVGRPAFVKARTGTNAWISANC